MRSDGAQRTRVAHLIYSPSVGGSEMAAAEVCRHLDRSIFDPMVLFMYGNRGPMAELLADAGIPAYSLKRARLRRLLWPALPAFSLARLKVDVLHVHHIPLLAAIRPAVRLARIKALVFTEHAKFTISRSPHLQEECRRAAEAVGSFITVSEDLRAYFVESLGIRGGSIRVIRNGVDTARFAPGTRTKELTALLPRGLTRPVVVTVGRLTEAKDHDTLFSAMAHLKASNRCPYVLVVGDGDRRRSLEKAVVERGLSEHIRFLGSRSDVDRLLPGVDAFVLSSQREGLPVVILEAMAAGLPVVATRVGGIPEVIRDGYNGVLVPPRNPIALGEALRRVVGEEGFGRRLGEQARACVEKEFSLEWTTAQYAAVYRSLVQGASAADACAAVEARSRKERS